MLFNSYEFIFLFLPITLLIFYQLGERGYYRWAIAWLVAASLWFYGQCNPAYLGLLLFSIVFNYILGRGIAEPLVSPLSRKLLLIFGITVNLAVLGYFKYANFLVDSINDWTGTRFVLKQMILPLAISFFTFEQISYLVDSFKGKIQAANFLQYCFYLSFFLSSLLALSSATKS